MNRVRIAGVIELFELLYTYKQRPKENPVKFSGKKPTSKGHMLRKGFCK